MLSLPSLLIGFGIGAVSAAIVFQLAFGSGARQKAMSEVTNLWDLASLGEARVIAERLDGFVPPPGTRIVLPAGSGHLAEELTRTCDVRTHPDVRENAALGRGRALIFTSALRPGAVAVSTTDPALLTRLEHDWDQMWKDAEPFAPTVSLVQVSQHVGAMVEVRGVDAGMTDYRGRHVLRVESDGHALPVIVQGDTGLAGQPVRVIGRVVRADGMTCVEAVKVLPLGKPRVPRN